MGNTCTPMADSCGCMAKTIKTNKHKYGLVEFSSLWRRLLWVGLQHTQGSER